MTLVWIILTLVGLLALAAVVLHFLPRSSDVRIAKLEDDANWLWDHVFPSHAAVPPAPAVPVVPAAPKYAPGTVLVGGGAAGGAMGWSGVVQGDGTVLWSSLPPAGMVSGKGGVFVQPCTVGEVFTAMKRVATPQGQGYQLGINWNQLEYLKELSAAAWAAWCASAATDPVFMAATENERNGFAGTLGAAGLVFPDAAVHPVVTVTP